MAPAKIPSFICIVLKILLNIAYTMPIVFFTQYMKFCLPTDSPGKPYTAC